MAKRQADSEQTLLERLKGKSKETLGKATAVTAIALGSAGLAACDNDAGATPQTTESTPAVTASVPENTPKAELQPLTCEEYADQLKASFPEPGSAEYQERVEQFSIPAEEGKTGEEVLEQIGQGYYDMFVSGVNILPSDLETQIDCVDKVIGSETDYIDLGDMLGLREYMAPQLDAIFADTNSAEEAREEFYETSAFFTYDALLQASSSDGRMPKVDPGEAIVSVDNQGNDFLNGDVIISGKIGDRDIDVDLGAGMNIVDDTWKFTAKRGSAS